MKARIINWRKNIPPGTIRKPNEGKPGAFVSVDQMVSEKIGFLSQGTGYLKGEIIRGSTVFL